MPSDNSGFFGSENFRDNIQNNRRIEQRERTPKQRIDLGKLSDLSPERWVDIICLSLIGLFLIVVACIWSAFSEFLFTHLLFPIIYVGSKIVGLIATIGTGIGLIFAKFRRRRYWW